jgi:N-acetylmuramoyl-L-alanine amidase
MTRSDDQFIPLEDRAAMANLWNADALVSIHGNTYKDQTVTGTETIYYTEESLPLAQVLQEEVAEALDIRNRGVKQKPLILLLSTHIPAAVIEVGYLTNPQDEKLLLSKDGQDRLASAIVEGLKGYANNRTPRNHEPNIFHPS